MDPREKSHDTLRQDVESMKNKIDQLVEAIIALEKREYNIKRTVVTENVIPPQVNDPAQPQHVWIPVENPTVLKCHIV
ncbi:unnamed protein product [Lathyrus oleraceus]